MSNRSSMSPHEMAQRTGGGLLSFPVTHFDESYDFVEGAYREHIGFLLEHGPAALFPAGGTGEFFSLTLQEYAQAVAAAVAETARRIPVIAGCGYGTRLAIQYARAAEQAGADGLLLLPPYLVKADAAGLIAHTQQVCAATHLGVIFYSRDNAVLDERALEVLCDTCPNLVGFKDGHGDLELITRIRARLGDRLFYIGGLPTAETFALPYLDIGVTTYSSAIFNFLPRFASEFYAAVKNRDQSSVLSKLREFVLPYVAIRNCRKGYAVSIVKAGMEVMGRSAGPVRPPLVGLRPNEMEELRALVGGLR